jgi:hypothetical protein
VEQQAITHDGEPGTETVDDRFVDLFRRRLTGVDHVEDLVPHRLLQPVGDVTQHLAVHLQRVLAG